MDRLIVRHPIVPGVCLPLALFFALTACGGGGGGSGGEGGSESVTITGTVVSVQAAALSSSAIADTVAVVVVNEGGQVADSALTRGDFTLSVPARHDYCLVFRDRQVSGATLGVLSVASSGGSKRGVFTLPNAGTAIDLGAVTLYTASGRAVSSRSITADLVAPATAYRDTDGDLIPDAMDRDDDGDGVADADDCAPLDAALYVTLTTRACVSDDADDDNDGVADPLDASPLDPTEQVDANSDPDVARLISALGHWSLTYTLVNTWTDTFDFDLVQDTGNGVFASGTNEYGDAAVIGAADSAGYDYGIYTSGTILGEAYFVNLTGDAVTGEYWQTDPITGQITSSFPYAITGSHTAYVAAVASRSIALPVDALTVEMQRVDEAAADHRHQAPSSDIEPLVRTLMDP